jgi:hypothetical protein
LIRWGYAFIDRPYDRFADACAFWTAVTGTGRSSRRGADGEFVTLVPPRGDPCLKVQGVHTTGGAHLDLSVEDTAGTVRRATELGATVIGSHDGWSVLRSPAGQLCCVVPWHGEAVRPPVVTRPDGTGSRLDQVCLDVGPAAYDAEVAFWRALTGWAHHQGSRPEFGVLQPPDGLPVRILLQRLDEERPASAHLDLACSDVEATRAWHEACGASHVATFPRWLVMRDPTGGVYCLTGRDPATGRLPG